MNDVTGVDVNSILRSVNETTSTQAGNEEKADFLQLLVAQLNNQDPLNPQDSTEFMSQLAQLETVQGIQDLNKSFASFSESMLSNQALQATSLVGRNVLISAEKGQLQTGEPLTGYIALPADAASVTLEIHDDKGALVRTLELGDHKQSNLAFSWDGFGDSGEALPPGEYSLVAKANIHGDSTEVSTAINFNVNSVTLDHQGGTLLNLAGSKVAPLSEVLQVR